MKQFEIQVAEHGPTVVFTVTGYFSKETGVALQAQLAPFLGLGRNSIILDLAPCVLINSPGVASVMNLAVSVMDDYHGRFLAVGLDETKRSVFQMVGLLPLIEVFPGLEQALEAVAG